jgi:hypothetical protein
MRVARGVLRGTNFFGATADGRMRVSRREHASAARSGLRTAVIGVEAQAPSPRNMNAKAERPA